MQLTKESKVLETETCIQPDKFKKTNIEELKNAWREKRMYGQFLDKTKSWNWVRKTDLKPRTVSLIFSSQEQALRTNYSNVHIDETSESSLCRLCGVKSESISHLVSECSKLSQKKYKARHDSVAQIIHWELCCMYGFEREKKWYEHEPQSVLENEETKILWDYAIQCDHFIQSRKPDIVLVEKSKKECKIIDVAVPDYVRVGNKEEEKVKKYQDLRREIAKLWGMKKTEVIPNFIGALGMISKKLETWIKRIGINITTVALQKSMLLGTARILRRTLDM